MEKQSRPCSAQRSVAAADLQSYLPDQDTAAITNSLAFGLTTLRNLLFQRIHLDVEQNFGQDSMLLPVSAVTSERQAKLEIDAYQIAVSALTVGQRSYGGNDASSWYPDWLRRLQIGDVEDDSKWRRRIRRYLAASDDRQRLEFSRHLENVFPQASRAPLILYRLLPLAIQIVTAVAFGECLQAVELRSRQAFWLPVISDCHECHGRPLDNGETCPVCGNPLWNYTWLTAAD